MRNTQSDLNRYFSFTPFLPHFSAFQKIYKNNFLSVVEGVSLLGVPLANLYSNDTVTMEKTALINCKLILLAYDPQSFYSKSMGFRKP